MPGHFDLRLEAKGGLFKAEFEIIAEIGALPWTAPPPLLGPAPKEHIEDVVKAPKAAEAAEGVKAALAGSGALRALKGGVAESIVLGSRFGVGEDLVGLADLLKLRLSLRVIFVDVRVILPGEATVRLLDLVSEASLETPSTS